jgi:eukaryotic-like serine/threonine-protein kinase
MDPAKYEVDSDPLIGKLMDGRYRVVSRIGNGGMGAVYIAEHVTAGKRFAIKVLDPAVAHEPEVVARFELEAKAAAAIGDDHIVKIVELRKLSSGVPYLVMEWLQGQDLEQELRAYQGRFPIARTIAIAVQCCRALGAAHKKGIVHRDVKPENIFLTERRDGKDFVKILDFGISKIVEANSELFGRPLTWTGSAVGSPHYMAPEQLLGDKTLDARADVYSMGVVIFKMLVGRVPFDAANYQSLVMKIINQPPPSMLELRADLPMELQRVVFCAMAKTAKARFASMAEFAKALGDLRLFESQ